MYNDKILKSVAEAVKQVVEAELSTKQKAIAKIAEPKHKIDSGDLAGLRAGKKPVTESDLPTTKAPQKTVTVRHKTSEREKVIVDTPEARKRNAEMGYHPVKEEAEQKKQAGINKSMDNQRRISAETMTRKQFVDVHGDEHAHVWDKVNKGMKEGVEQVEEASHQAKTTMKHISKPTAGEMKATKDMKPGVAGYRDRIAMLKSAEARGALKKEEAEQVDEAKEPGFRSSYGIGKKAPAAKKPETYGKRVQGKGYDNPENERKAPEGHVSMTSLMPGHDERAARFLARQVAGTGRVVKGKAQGAIQKEESSQEEFNTEIKKAQAKSQGKTKADVAKPTVVAVKQESVERVDERTLSKDEMEKREKYVKSMKKGLQGFKDRYGERGEKVMYATATKQAKES